LPFLFNFLAEAFSIKDSFLNSFVGGRPGAEALTGLEIGTYKYE